MNNTIAPSYQHCYGAFCVLWFEQSNTYSVIDADLKAALDAYLDAPNIESFAANFDKLPITEVQNIASNIKTYLESCHSGGKNRNDKTIAFEEGHRHRFRTYRILNTYTTIHFDNVTVEKMIHPAIAHFEGKPERYHDVVFDMYITHDQMHLFQNENLLFNAHKRDYHFIQGKFKMALFNLLHQKEEKDWIGTIHASTITDGDSAIAFIGNSGSGKSTLCSLLVAHGFELLADDISPLALGNSHIYHNPAAISIKQKAFSVLEPLFPEFDMLQEVKFNPKKGVLKYLPCPAPRHMFYPCNAMVLVNYESDAKTKLQSISVKTVLETIIPDSWLYPDQVHAKAFLNWLGSLKFYKLTYSDNLEMIDTVSKLFNS